MIDNNENGITLTADNIEFPTHFYLTSTETGAVDCCNNKRIKEYIQKGIDFLRTHLDEYDWFTATGNLYLDIRKWEGDGIYEITVTNRYYSTEIPFEPKDYDCYAD